MPSSSHTSCIGTLKRKYATYDLWDLGDDSGQNLVGGDEVKGISCLLPRKKKKGKLYQGWLFFKNILSMSTFPHIAVGLAPKPIARHLVLAAQPVKPTMDETSSETFKNPQRPSYPKELLKHRFMPYGSLTKPSADETSTNDPGAASGVPTNEVIVQPLKSPSTSNQEKLRKSASLEILEIQPKKSKKRKTLDVEIIDTPTPKKAKKAKAVS